MATWLTQEQYGNGSNGDKVLSGTFGTDFGYIASCTGSGTSLSATNANFAVGQIVLVHQTQNINSTAGWWDVGVISNYSAGTITLKYALANTYYTGAQVIAVPKHRRLTGSVTLSAWNGTTGGI